MKRVLGVLALSLALAAILAVVAVEYLIPEPRRLTRGERDALASVFGDQLDYEPIRIGSMPLPPSMTAFVFRDRITFRTGYYQDDYSGDYLPMSTLVHEAAHVWQWQRSGSFTFWKAIAERLMQGDGVYAYDTLTPAALLEDFRFEQQARILEDYYVRRHLGTDVSVYEAIISRSLPLTAAAPVAADPQTGR